MVESPGKYDCAFDQALHAQHDLLIPTRVAHVNFWVTERELEIFRHKDRGSLRRNIE